MRKQDVISQLFNRQNSRSGRFPLVFEFPFTFPKPPGIALAPLRMPRASDNSCTTMLLPREHHATIIFSPGGGGDPPTHAVQSHSIWRRGCCLQNKNSFCFTVLVCFAEPASHTGAAASGLGASTSLPGWLLTAMRLRCVRALPGCSWTERRWWPRLGQPGPGKWVTSGSVDRSPSPSACVSSPEPHRSTRLWQPAGLSLSAPWSRGLCSPVGRRASTWVRWGGGHSEGSSRQREARLAGGVVEGALDSEPGTWGLLSPLLSGFQLRVCPHI